MVSRPNSTQSSRPAVAPTDAESLRLVEDRERRANWKRWGPYLAERQWGTVREDYSAAGTAWDHFPHDHARSRAYRWGEDGLLGICDRQCRLCFSVALWNERDPIVKERLFGLTGPEGNHGEDVKESYFYLDATPTHSYMKGLYKYPQGEFPYRALVEENGRRGKDQPEFELADTGAFDGGRYFDVTLQYAKADPDDILIRIDVSNRGPDAARLHVLPTLWFRNTWGWGRLGEGHGERPAITRHDGALLARHAELGDLLLAGSALDDGAMPDLLFTENDTNTRRLYDHDDGNRHTKDAFHAFVVHGDSAAVNPAGQGTKAAFHYVLEVKAGATATLRLRLAPAARGTPDLDATRFDAVFDRRLAEADAFYDATLPAGADRHERAVARQAYAGLLWSKQFFHYSVEQWLAGDPAKPTPPAQRKEGRNRDWGHLYNRDVLSMPDKWEYPWFAAWDLAFHMIPFSRVDPDFAKHQLELFLREWYMHPNGQIPAYEWALGDVNPPVHAWAVWRVYKRTGRDGQRDRAFLAGAFHKLLINFTWWVNRKDVDGRHLFAGGFLGLDNIGVFDRSQPLPTGGHLEQADGTAWMAFYCLTLLSMALELAAEDSTYDGMASKFFEHFVAIVDAMNGLGDDGLWHEEDGFYYDKIHAPGGHTTLRTRSMVGLIPLLAVEVLDDELIQRLPGFARRMEWYLHNRRDVGETACFLDRTNGARKCRRLLAVPSRERLERVLRYLLDENEFLSPHGIRSLSRVHRDQPFVLHVDGTEHRVQYVPGESDTGLFGGNSNWRGPVWFPINFLLIEALQRYHHFFGDSFQVEFPTGSGHMLTLDAVAAELATRLVSIFVPAADGSRPCHADDPRFRDDPHWRDLVLFHEYFHGDNGRGVGASHQTGWTALVATLLEDSTRNRHHGRAADRPSARHSGAPQT